MNTSTISPHMIEIHSYVVSSRVASSLMTIIGIVSNTLVVILSKKRNDQMNYVTLMKICSIINIFRLATGFTGLMRVQCFKTHCLFFIHGWGGLFLPRFVSFVIDAIGIVLINSSYLLVPVCMIFRCSILHDYKPQLHHIYLSVLICFLLVSPFPISTFIGYIGENHSPKFFNNSTLLLEEAQSTPFYIYLLKYKWQRWIQMVGLSLALPATPIVLLLRFVMLRHLRLYKRSLSLATKEVHRSFIKLLTLDSVVILIGVAVFLIQQAISHKLFGSEDLLIEISLYNYAIFALIPTIQACATLYYVAYLRVGILGFFIKKEKEMDNHSVSAISVHGK